MEEARVTGRFIRLSGWSVLSRDQFLKVGMRAIAQGLSRACSTVSREVARHGGRAQYRANEADQHAWESACAPSSACWPCMSNFGRSLRVN